MKYDPLWESKRTHDGMFHEEGEGTSNGRFRFFREGKIHLLVLASTGEETGWEHVSVSAHYRKAGGKVVHRMPTWDEMDFVKRTFWEDDEAVMQLHPPRKNWVNNHPFVLHLWKPRHQEIPLPPALLVGLPGFKFTNLGGDDTSKMHLVPE